MADPVRLVVRDLDETFWRGTLVEGGIREYERAHHEIVVELARRGILSSLCSKNDEQRVVKSLSIGRSSTTSYLPTSPGI
jgi:predicted enzyme involved in methoxymalonyl-ACP biosynthesis